MCLSPTYPRRCRSALAIDLQLHTNRRSEATRSARGAAFQLIGIACPPPVHRYFAIESAVALFASFWINLFVVGTYAHTFFDRTCAEAPGGPYASLPLTSDGGFDGSICQVSPPPLCSSR